NGIWTKKSKGEPAPRGTSLNKVVPTKSHMALAALVGSGKCRFIVSTNGDGLHLRSGVPTHKISEMHGNSFKYGCNGCKTYWFVFPEMKHDEIWHCVVEGTCPKCASGLSGTGVRVEIV